MSELIIITAGGLARETLVSARAAGWTVRGFLDDDPALAGGSVRDVAVLGRTDEVGGHPDAVMVIAAGRGAVRRTIASRLRNFGVEEDRFTTVVDPSVAVPPTCTIGPGSIVLAGAVLTTDISIGRHVVIMPRVTLTHDDVVEEFATLCAGVSLGGGVRIGAAAYLGMNAGVREGCTVGAEATLGMGAAAVADLPPGATWAGVPARPLPGRAGR